MKKAITNNDQWQIESLEKMAHYNRGPIGEGNPFFEYVAHDQPHDYEKLHSSTPVKGKGGEQLYHHIFIHKNTDPSKDDKYDVHHVLSQHKDPRKPGVAGGLTVYYKNVDVSTKDGRKNVKNGGVVEGIRVTDDAHRGKGYGQQMFHNMVHHHGTLIGDKHYSGQGEALVNKMAIHPAYDHIGDTKQSLKDSDDENKVTRRVFSLKNKANVGKIPTKYLK